MAFNILLHVKDHAHTIINDQMQVNNNEKLVHFKCSIDSALFISQGYNTQVKIDNIMHKMMQELSEYKLEISEKNGSNISKHNIITPKTRIRQIKFDTLLSAYHSVHFDKSKIVNPHFHFLGRKNVRLGLRFSYLKRALIDVSSKYGLTFHFADIPRKTGLTKKQEASVKSMSWILEEGIEKKMIDYLSDSSRLKMNLELLYQHYTYSKNISYFLKIMSVVNQRLSQLNIDFVHQGVNLKKSIYFPLNKVQINTIQLLKEDKKVNLDMRKVFDREILKYAYGLGSVSMSILVNKFDIPKIDKDKLSINAARDCDVKKEKVKSNFRDLVLFDITNAIKISTSEKTLKTTLIEMGYVKVSFKTRRLRNNCREKIAINLVTPKQMAMTFTFPQIGKSWFKIKEVLTENKIKDIKKVLPKSKINEYKRSSQNSTKNFKLFKYKVRLRLSITTSNQNMKNRRIKFLSDDYFVTESEMYDITTYESKNSMFVDYGHSVVLKESDSTNINQTISDILELLELKGWILDDLAIEGLPAIIDEFQLQVQSLTSAKDENMNRLSEIDINDLGNPSYPLLDAIEVSQL